MFDESFIAFLLGAGTILLLLGILIFMIREWTGFGKSKHTWEPEISEVPPVHRQAYTVDKRLGEEYKGSQQAPVYCAEFQVLFRDADGKEEWLAVSEEEFQKIPLHNWNELITQDGYFVDFGGLFGESME